MTQHDKKSVIQSILSVFETGRPEGDYGAVVILPDGAGISYGKHQATDAGGNLDAILLRYLDLGGARGDELSPYLERLRHNETAAFTSLESSPKWVQDLAKLLQDLGRTDATMRRAQDKVFDEAYWRPCVDHCNAMELELPLSICLVYDTCIQSGSAAVSRMRRRFAQVPPSRGGDERTWALAYMRARRAWLANYGEPGHIVRRTVVRMDTLMKIAADDNWMLETPISIGAPYRVVIS